jgi:hypothetical protein
MLDDHGSCCLSRRDRRSCGADVTAKCLAREFDKMKSEIARDYFAAQKRIEVRE